MLVEFNDSTYLSCVPNFNKPFSFRLNSSNFNIVKELFGSRYISELPSIIDACSFNIVVELSCKVQIIFAEFSPSLSSKW
jgi:hypothetical protein